MALRIVWTDFAKAELKSIFDYYKRTASLNLAKNLVVGILGLQKKHLS